MCVLGSLRIQQPELEGTPSWQGEAITLQPQEQMSVCALLLALLCLSGLQLPHLEEGDSDNSSPLAGRSS